ncbi:hypothetical protein ACHWQZ_G002370 [Mnemiopsis leidyi]
MATDKEGDLIGVYLAGIYRRGDWLKKAIAGDILLCVSNKSPVIGVGTELVRQGEIAAKEKNCDLALCVTTNSYVQRVLRDSGYVLRSVVVLCDFKDEDGRLFIEAADEDSSARVLFKNLKI